MCACVCVSPTVSDVIFRCNRKWWLNTARTLSTTNGREKSKLVSFTTENVESILWNLSCHPTSNVLYSDILTVCILAHIVYINTSRKIIIFVFTEKVPRQTNIIESKSSNYLMHTQNKSVRLEMQESVERMPLPLHLVLAEGGWFCLFVYVYVTIFAAVASDVAAKSLCDFLSLVWNHPFLKCDAIVGKVDANLIMKNELNGVNAVLLCVRL